MIDWQRYNNWIRAQFEAGHSAQKISENARADLDVDVTRNAIIGRLHRMGLKKHPGGIRQVNKQSGRASARVAKMPNPVMRSRKWKKKADSFDYAFTPIAESVPVSIADRRANQCAWPVGDDPFMFCGAPRREHPSYCRHHHARSCAYELPTLEEAA